jgi:hypothetical protein
MVELESGRLALVRLALDHGATLLGAVVRRVTAGRHPSGRPPVLNQALVRTILPVLDERFSVT